MGHGWLPADGLIYGDRQQDRNGGSMSETGDEHGGRCACGAICSEGETMSLPATNFYCTKCDFVQGDARSIYSPTG